MSNKKLFNIGYITFVFIITILYVYNNVHMFSKEYFSLAKYSLLNLGQNDWFYWYEEPFKKFDIFSNFFFYLSSFFSSPYRAIYIINIVFFIFFIFVLACVLHKLVVRKEEKVLWISSLFIIGFASIHQVNFVFLTLYQPFTKLFLLFLTLYSFISFSSNSSLKKVLVAVTLYFILIMTTELSYPLLMSLVILMFIQYKQSLFENKYVRISYIVMFILTFIIIIFVEDSFALNLINIPVKNLLAYYGGIVYFISGHSCYSLDVILGGLFVFLYIYMTYLIFKNKLFNNKYILFIYIFVNYYLFSGLYLIGKLNIEQIYVTYKHSWLLLSWLVWLLLMLFFYSIYKRHYLIKKLFLYLYITCMISFLTIWYQNVHKDFQNIQNRKLLVMGLNFGIKDDFLASVVLQNSVTIWKKKEDEKLPSIFDRPYTNAEFLYALSLEKRYHENSVFSNSLIQNLTKNMDTVIKHKKRTILGHIDRIYHIHDYSKYFIKLDGWLFDGKDTKEGKIYYITNYEDKVVGFMMQGFKRQSVANILKRKEALYSGCIGYIIDQQQKGVYFIVDPISKFYKKIML